MNHYKLMFYSRPLLVAAVQCIDINTFVESKKAFQVMFVKWDLAEMSCSGPLRLLEYSSSLLV